MVFVLSVMGGSKKGAGPRYISVARPESISHRASRSCLRHTYYRRAVRSQAALSFRCITLCSSEASAPKRQYRHFSEQLYVVLIRVSNQLRLLLTTCDNSTVKEAPTVANARGACYRLLYC